MKNLFVLMALAGLAAFQVGCGDDAKAPSTKPSAPAGAGTMPGMPGMPATGDASKKTDDDKPAGDAAATDGDKAADGDAAPADEEKDKEAPKE